MPELKSTSSGELYTTVKDLLSSDKVQDQLREIKQSSLFQQLRGEVKKSSKKKG